MKNLKEKTKLTRICVDCGGEGDISKCCEAELDGNRCMSCNKFAKKTGCYSCNGGGFEEYNVGDEVEVFVCVYSNDMLKKELYNAKKSGDCKTFTGKIIAIINNYKVKVKVKRKELDLDIDDIEIR